MRLTCTSSGDRKMLILLPPARRRNAGFRVPGHHHLPVGRRHDVVGAQIRGAVGIAEEEEEEQDQDDPRHGKEPEPQEKGHCCEESRAKDKGKA